MTSERGSSPLKDCDCHSCRDATAEKTDEGVLDDGPDLDKLAFRDIPDARLLGCQNSCGVCGSEFHFEISWARFSFVSESEDGTGDQHRKLQATAQAGKVVAQHEDCFVLHGDSNCLQQVHYNTGRESDEHPEEVGVEVSSNVGWGQIA